MVLRSRESGRILPYKKKKAQTAIHYAKIRKGKKFGPPDQKWKIKMQQSVACLPLYKKKKNQGACATAI
jgi:hypothetical protein